MPRMPMLSFDDPAVHQLRQDLALALRAAAHHGLAEGVCNHFSVELPDGSGRFFIRLGDEFATTMLKLMDKK